MDLTARDVEQKQFHDQWRGYNQAEVDDFLDRVAESLDRMQRENAALKERIGGLEQATATSKEREEMLTKTLVTAQKAAEDAIAKAKARAEQMVTQAEERARRANEEADQRISAADAEVRRKHMEAEAEQRRRGEEIERRHQARRRELDASVQRLVAQEAELKQRLRGFLEQQLRTLDKLTERAPQPAPARPGEARAHPPSQRPSAPPGRSADAATQAQPAVRPDRTGAQERQDTPQQPTEMGASEDQQEGAAHRRSVRSIFWRDEH